MITLIQNGESQEKYATWAKSAPQSVRLALAEKKYELDRLSKDEDPVIVVTVMKKSKEHLRKIMQSAIKIELVRSAISYDVTIDKDILENQIQQAEKRKKLGHLIILDISKPCKLSSIMTNGHKN